MKSLLCLLILLLASCLSSKKCHAQGPRFSLPLHGTPGVDYWIDYYVDHDNSDSAKDGHCGTKTYNGHTGTDFLLQSFKTMDSGVFVYAIADGQVIGSTDGLFDRSKQWIGGGLGNYLRITHGRYIADYGHLMKNSLLVGIGDHVKAGQAIARVGSSGYSVYPHLHLELHDLQHNLIDPFYGNCNTATPVQWTPEPGYDTSVYAIDYGFVPYIPDVDTLTERYLVKSTFYNYRETVVCLWALMHGLRSGDRIRVEWYAPDGSLYFTRNDNWKNNWWYDYSWAYLEMPLATGRWKAKYFLNGKLLISGDFYVG